MKICVCSIKNSQHIILRKQVDTSEKLVQHHIREIASNQQIIMKSKTIHMTVQRDSLNQFGYSPKIPKSVH